MANEIDIMLLRGILPERPDDAHKGTFGHLFVIAGSRGFTGAAKLACEAAGRSGVGLVTVGVPRPLGDVIASSLTETMSIMLPSTESETLAASALEPALEFAEGKDAVVIGPGISQNPETRDFVMAFVRRSTAPLLIDADGINAVSSEPDVLKECRVACVLTPHPGEMGRLLKKSTAEVQADRERAAVEAARHFGCTVVLKGYRTVIANADGRIFINPTGNNGLSKGGTGDVLSGLIGGLIAQHVDSFDAALLGVYLHGLAGDIAAREKTRRGMIASDVIACLPGAWRMIEEAGEC